MKYTIYCLKCPIKNEIKYVGRSKNIKDRYRRHCNIKSSVNENMKQWILELNKIKMLPLLDILETNLEMYQAEEKEKFYIKKFDTLLNISGGGLLPPNKKGYKFSLESRRKKFETSPLKKKVYQYNKKNELIAEFEGVREACRITGIDHRSIAQVASGSKIRKSAGGFIWKYN